MEIAFLKENLGWEGVLPLLDPRGNKRHHNPKPTQNRVEGSYANTKIR